MRVALQVAESLASMLDRCAQLSLRRGTLLGEGGVGPELWWQPDAAVIKGHLGIAELELSLLGEALRLLPGQIGAQVLLRLMPLDHAAVLAHSQHVHRVRRAHHLATRQPRLTTREQHLPSAGEGPVGGGRLTHDGNRVMGARAWRRPGSRDQWLGGAGVQLHEPAVIEQHRPCLHRPGIDLARTPHG